MAMLQSMTTEEQILYWLSLDLQVRALAERLLQRFAVTVGPASQCHAPPRRVRRALASFAGSGAQGFGTVRGQHGHGAAARDLPRPKALRSEFSSFVEVLTPGGLL